jgi:thiamine-monophosphate kinase
MQVLLGPGTEFDRIRAIAARLGDRASGLGDDCATIPDGPGFLMVSTDTSVEEVHFKRTWLEPEEIGWRAAMAAFSDLAAGAARPIGLLAALTSPDHGEDLVRIMDGVGDAVRGCGAVVMGGNLSRGPVLSLTSTVIGRAPRPMGRSGGMPGDGIWVTGSLGGARAALVAWNAGRIPSRSAREAFARPVARIEAGVWLATHRAHAQMDISDGLAGDLGHLAAGCGTGATVVLENLPIHTAVPGSAELAGQAPEVMAAEGGEDFELLVALPPTFGSPEADRFRAECGLPITRIGTLTTEPGVRLLLDGHPMTLRGHDHFG